MICVFGPGMNAHMESMGLNLSLMYSEKKEQFKYSWRFSKLSNVAMEEHNFC